VQPLSPAEFGFVLVKFSRCGAAHRFFDDEIRLADSADAER
jgi:hypothetical protein